jgi:hypothetical protein
MLLRLITHIHSFLCQKGCNENFHKHCVNIMPKICNKRLQIKLSVNPSTQKNSTVAKLVQSITVNDMSSSPSSSTASTARIQIEHSFIYKRLQERMQQVACLVCNEKIKSKTYKICQDCKIITHENCSSLAEKNCSKKSNDDDNDDDNPTDDESFHTDDRATNTANNNINIKTRSISDIDEETGSQIGAELAGKVYQGNKSAKTGRPDDKPRKKNQIMLQRISQRVKKHADFFWRGHMIYATNKETKVKDFIRVLYILFLELCWNFNTYRLQQ